MPAFPTTTAQRRRRAGESDAITPYEAGRLGTAIRDHVNNVPVFCSDITAETAEDVAEMLHYVRNEPDGYADRAILKATLEAVGAYLSGANAGAVGGFYRVAASAIRAARYIEHLRDRPPRGATAADGAGEGPRHG